MAAPIATNRYKLPPGYRAPRTLFGTNYQTPWNGYIAGYNSPGAVYLGAVNGIFEDVSILPPGSVMTLLGPNGKEYSFQFIAPTTGPVWSEGIKVNIPDVPEPGDIITGLMAVMGLPSGVDFDGDTIVFPWTVEQGDPQAMHVNWTVAGSASFALVPGLIINVFSQMTQNAGFVVPGKLGPCGATLPPAT